MKRWPLCAWPLCFWMYSFFGGTPCIFQCVFSQIINLVNTWSQSCHKIMKNGESHWLVIDCDARFVTDRNHKSNKVCHKEGLASLASSSHQIRLINTQWTAFFIQKQGLWFSERRIRMKDGRQDCFCRFWKFANRDFCYWINIKEGEAVELSGRSNTEPVELS